MPYRSNVRKTLAEYTEAESAVWLIGPDWRFRGAHGPGFDRIQTQPEHLLHRSALQFYGERDRRDLIAFFRGVMDGQPAATVVEFEGTVWMIDAQPASLSDGTGALCLGHVLDRHPVLEVETTPEPVPYTPPVEGQVWTAAYAVPEAGVREGDRWRCNGEGRGVTQTSTRSVYEFQELLICQPELTHYRGRDGDGADLYVSAGDNIAFRVWSGDKWYVAPGSDTVLQIRLRATSELAELWAAHPDLFIPRRAESPESARASLRVL